ncbi:MAG: polar amino acid transport system substrate-binding protein [Flavobacteriales bacterium]
MHILLNTKYYILVFFTLTLFTGVTWAQTKFHFASIDGLAEQEIAEKMIVPIFKSAGFDIKIEAMPAGRARAEVVAGRKDGSLLRIFSYGENNPSLIRVPTPYSTVETVAFALESKNISITSIDELGEQSLVIVRGVQTTHDLTKNFPNVHAVTYLSQAMRFLKAGRADILITSDIGALAMIKRLNITNITPIFEISSLPLYVYFNFIHKNAVSKIDTAIKEKIRTGELKMWRNQFREEYLDAIN